MYLVRVAAYRSSHFCSGVARIFQRGGGGGGGKASERSGRRGCPPSMVYREVFENLCIKQVFFFFFFFFFFFCILNIIIRGSGLDQSPACFVFLFLF